MLELAHLPLNGFPGMSLLRPERGRPPTRAPVITEVQVLGDVKPGDPTFYGPMRAVLLDDWHLIRNGFGNEELYNVRRDPEEVVNLISVRSHSSIRDSLRLVLNRAP